MKTVVVVSVKAAFGPYKSGVFDDPKCDCQMNHAMAVVGYGTTPQGVRYWIVKNSWGKNWGDHGYIKIKRGAGNTDYGMCCILRAPCYSMIAKAA